MIQLLDSELDTKIGICSVQVKQNGSYMDWGDFSCMAFFNKNSTEISRIKIDGINSKINVDDRIIFRRNVYEIAGSIEDVFELKRNDMESSFLKFEDMGIPISRGVMTPIHIPLSPEEHTFTNQWMGIWIRNIAKHYDDILQGDTIVSIRNKCKDAPAVIVGAGPSLDKNIEDLKGINAIIICVDRAYKALLARGIEPDLVVSVDCHDDLICGYLNNADSSKHILALNTAADYKIAKIWKGRILYYNMAHGGIQFFDSVLPFLFPGFPAVQNAGCVVNTASIIANWMGCKPLILAGSDFSYPGNKIACDTYDYIDGRFQKVDVDEKERFKKRGGKVKVNGIYTYPPFLEYMKSIKMLDEKQGFNIINATEGGIIKIFPEMTLKEAKVKYCSENVDEMRKTIKED